MKPIRFCLIFIVLSFYCSLFGQSKNANYVDTATNMFWTGANFSYQWPGGKLGELFKGNFNVGTGFTYKTASNWTWSANFSYFFGSNNLRGRDDLDHMHSLFGGLVNSHGDIMNGDGLRETVTFEGRYWSVNGGVGKIIPLDRWKNSGLWIHANFGFIQHKIRIDHGKMVSQLDGDYIKGYDYRSSGFCMSQFVGYLFMRKNRIASFYAGIEVYEMWTRPDRSYIFAVGPTDDMKNEFSALIGAKIGWIVPLFEKKKTIRYYQ